MAGAVSVAGVMAATGAVVAAIVRVGVVECTIIAPGRDEPVIRA